METQILHVRDCVVVVGSVWCWRCDYAMNRAGGIALGRVSAGAVTEVKLEAGGEATLKTSYIS